MRVSTGWTADNDVMTSWDALIRLKYDAATLSSEDLPDFEKLPPAAKAMVVLANVTTQDGKPLAPPYTVKTVKLADGRRVRVAIIGLLGLSPYGTKPNPNDSPANLPWKVTDPTAALQAVLPEAQKKSDITVALFSGSRDAARKMVQAVPGLNVMIIGLEGAIDQKVEMVNNTALMQNAERGRYGATLGITVDKDRHAASYDLRNTGLDESFPLDPSMADLLKEYHDKQARPPATTTPTTTTTTTTNVVTPATAPSTPASMTSLAPAKGQWAGSYACGGCHTEEYNQWKGTKHAMAMASLEQAQGGVAAKRADCVGCHTVGFNKPDGYDLARPRWDLKGVGCEDCHGPAQAHVDARLRRVADTSKLIRTPSQATCVTCHNKDNSPDFNYSTYLPKVMHKAAKA